MIDSVAGALGVAVVQSLWQCTLIGAATTLLALAVKRASARYGIWCVAMLGSFAWFCVTFVDALGVEVGASGGTMGGMLAGGGAADTRMGLFEFIAIAWAIGFGFVGIRFGRQWFAARSLRVCNVVDADESLIAMFDELRGVFGVSRRVRVIVSEIAQSPMVVGWFVPVVVVPASVISMMGPEQVRLVLAHELAHIRRYDHLVNMLQVLVESVLFYHPVVWWMSRQARIEREHCCDDAAVRVAGDAVMFARALADLEEVRLRSRAVLGLHQGGSLMNRIQRLLSGTESRRGTGATAMLSAAILVAGTAYAYTTTQEEPELVEVPETVFVGVEYVEREKANAEIVEFLRRQVASSALTRDQAFELYRRSVEESYEQSLRLIESKILEAVEAGKLSEVDGNAKLEGEREGIAWEMEHRFLVDVYLLPAGEAKIDLLGKKLDAEVAAGWLTREQAQAELEWAIESMNKKVHQGVVIVEGVPMLDSLPIVVEEQPILDGTQKFKILLQKELDAKVERGELEMEEAQIIYEGYLLKTLPADESVEGEEVIQIGVLVSPEAVPVRVETGVRYDASWEFELEPTDRKLTPMDELYWHHQGIRSLDAYDDESLEGC